MGTDNLGDKETPDAVADSAAEPVAPATPSDAMDAAKAGRIFRELLSGVAEIDLWINAGHTPACFGLTEDLAALADLFVAGSDTISDQLKDAASLIKGCAVCTEVLETTTEDLGGTLPQAWLDLKPATVESLPEGAEEGSNE